MASKAEQSARTRAALMEAAIGAFGERGYRATSLKTIAAQAGITHGVIPFHFGSKEGLLLAVVEECFETFRTAVFGPLAGGARDYALGDLAALVDSQLAFQDEHPEVGRLFQVLMFEAIGPSPELRPHFEQFHRRVYELGCAWLRAGREAGSIDPALDVEATVEAMLCFFTGVRTHSLLFGLDRSKVHGAMLAVLTGGVLPRNREGD